MDSRLVVLAVGEDKPGLVAGVTSMIAQAKGNIEDMDQVVLQNVFVMSLLVSLEDSTAQPGRLIPQLVEAGGKLGLKVHVYPVKDLKS